MQAITFTVLNPLFMPLLFGRSGRARARDHRAGDTRQGRRALATGGGCCSLGCAGVMMALNVPLDQELRRQAPGDPPRRRSATAALPLRRPTTRCAPSPRCRRRRARDRRGPSPRGLPWPRAHDQPRGCAPRCGSCARAPGRLTGGRDAAREYPQAFVEALTASGLLAALIPPSTAALGSGSASASIVLEEIDPLGGSAAACHAQMYTMGALLRHRQRGAEGASTCRGSRAARCACRRSRSPRPRPARTPRASPPPPAATATSTWSTATRTGPAGSPSPTSCCCSRAPPSATKHAAPPGLSLFLVDLREVGAEAIEITQVRTMFN